MNYRRLGSSDLEVSEISLGSWLTYSGGVTREQAEACVQAAFDEGINFIDTANVYGRGASEELLGEVLAGRERSSYVLATKVYFPMSDTDKGLSKEQIHKQMDASLQRLRTDYVDLYQCHRFDRDTPLEETMAALTEVVQEGKARYIGFSEWPVEEVERSLALPGVERWVSSQPQYSMLVRTPEAELIPALRTGGHLADRLVAARAGRARRPLPPRRDPAVGLAGREREHGRLHRRVDDRADPRGASSGCATSPPRPG